MRVSGETLSSHSNGVSTFQWWFRFHGKPRGDVSLSSDDWVQVLLPSVMTYVLSALTLLPAVTRSSTSVVASLPTMMNVFPPAVLMSLQCSKLCDRTKTSHIEKCTVTNMPLLKLMLSLVSFSQLETYPCWSIFYFSRLFAATLKQDTVVVHFSKVIRRDLSNFMSRTNKIMAHKCAQIQALCSYGSIYTI